MALLRHRTATRTRRALRAAVVALCAAWVGSTSISAKETKQAAESGAPASGSSSPFPEGRSISEELPPAEDRAAGPADSEFLDPKSADFEDWQSIGKEHEAFEDVELRPFDWMRHAGFRHSSTDGRFVDKNIPLTTSSWLNRPYHIDWFVGPLLSDDPVQDRVTQSNEVFGGLRAGWDFDYYWGLEWRFGWAGPQIFNDGDSTALDGHYFVSDFDVIYYPWGDTRVRPYFQAGLGLTQIDSVHADGTPHQATLMSMPFGMGLRFPQTPWLAWRLEVVDNLAFGADSIDTMHNVAFTAGMEWRFGARPNSYWPWRSSRKIW